LIEALKDYGKISENLVAEIMRQLLSAVIFAHSKMVVHRDIKFSNIIA
jgi:serine/threonine protein kinase